MQNDEDWELAIRAAIGISPFLVVLDDVWQVEEALTLAVGGPHCAYLITTRFPHIAHHFAHDGVMVVQELDEQESLAFVARFAPEVVTDEPETMRHLVSLVGGLPLALALISKYLHVQAQSRQPRRVRAALKILSDAQERLHLSETRTLLDRPPHLAPDTSISLQAVIAVSERRVDEQARHALRALSVFPAKPNSFSEAAALAVCASPTEVLDTLMDAGLLETSWKGHYTLHQTIADYARVHSMETSVYERVIDYYTRFLEQQKTDHTLLEQKSSNILMALHLAFEQKMQRSVGTDGGALCAISLHKRRTYVRWTPPPLCI